MLSHLVVFVLSNTSGGASLGQHSPRGVYLLDHGALAQAELSVPPPPAMPAPSTPVHNAATVQAIRTEIASLRESMPSIGGGLAMAIIGGAGIVGGVLFGFFGLFLAVLNAGTTVLIASLVAIGLGIPVLVVGIVLLVQAGRQRGAIGGDIKALERQLQEIESPGSIPPPPGPPQVVGPVPGLLLAAF
jgi:hypothetical protein